MAQVWGEIQTGMTCGRAVAANAILAHHWMIQIPLIETFYLGETECAGEAFVELAATRPRHACYPR